MVTVMPSSIGLRALLAAAVFVVCQFTMSGSGAAGVEAPVPLEESAKADAFFQSPHLSTFDVQLGAFDYTQLARNPRQYVPARVTVDGRPFDVGVRLQGTGNFEPVSRHPNLTIKFNWAVRGQDFAGLTKIFCKNARQDPTLLCELAASGAFLDAGIPAPRITHARVRLNGRDLGLCVVAEAVNKRFLREHFNNAHGALYEGAFRDVRSKLDQDNGPPSDRSDVAALCSAALLNDCKERREALSKILDVGQFLDFLAVEMIVASWDGYALHQNNYRIYHEPASDRMTFIPHGLDNTFFESGMALLPPRKSILAGALLECAEDREAFRQRVAALIPRALDLGRLHGRVGSAVAKMKQGAAPGECAAIDRRAALLMQRATERLCHLRAQLAGEHPATPAFGSDGIAHLEGWTEKPDWNGSPVERLSLNGRPGLTIRATNGFCFGSWRLPLRLPPGKYRLEGVAMSEGVFGLPSMTGSGVGVRVLGTMRGGGLDGSCDWTDVRHEFSVQEGCEWVELIAELRAFAGNATFDADKFRLIQVRQ